MPVTFGVPPRNGHAVIAAPLAHLLAQRPHGSNALAGGPEKDPPPPMQLFRLGLTDAASGRALSAVVPIGWRYLLSGSDAVADVRMDSRDGEPRFGSLISGRLPERLAEAIALAHTMYDNRSGRLVARILEIPAIYRTALWLHGPVDVFFPVMESAARDEYPVARDDGFLARIQAEARREIAASEGGDALAG